MWDSVSSYQEFCPSEIGLLEPAQLHSLKDKGRSDISCAGIKSCVQQWQEHGGREVWFMSLPDDLAPILFPPFCHLRNASIMELRWGFPYLILLFCIVKAIEQGGLDTEMSLIPSLPTWANQNPSQRQCLSIEKITLKTNQSPTGN